MYIVKWKDWQGNEHLKTYKSVGVAMKKVFAVYGWYKNGELYRNETKII